MSIILIIDDEESMRHMLSIILKKEGYDAVSVEGGQQALKILEKDDFDFILCDIKMPGMDGLEFLRRHKTQQDTRHKTQDSRLKTQDSRLKTQDTRLKTQDSRHKTQDSNSKTDLSLKSGVLSLESVVIMMSAYGAIDTAIDCMRLGAYDYISKPFKTEEIILTLKKAEERERLKNENTRFKQMLQGEYTFENIIAQSPNMLDIFQLISKVADYNTIVLITGESGTGKELIARALHYNGNRRDRQFVAINCGAIPANLLESELFGHLKGAFTDAVTSKVGLFEEAEGGTIFLDEIGELPKELQVKLLRVIQEGELRRVGDSKSRKIDVRVIAATAKDLIEEIKLGNFREDLFYRLNVVPIKLPPIRERQADIPLLVHHFIARYSKKFGKSIKGADNEAMEYLLKYTWPGNVREIENVIERAVILEDGDIIKSKSLPFVQTQDSRLKTQDMSIKKAEEEIEKTLIKKALEMTNGNKTKAAELLEISHRSLLYKIKGYGL